MRKINLVFALVFLIISNQSLSQSFNQAPQFHLNHVDICVDTVTFNAILKNRFLLDSFSFVKVFTDSTGSEILLLGKESYIHFLPDKGFFENRMGTILLVHHSYQRHETKALMKYLQSFTDDSLYNRPYVSPELNIDYVNVYENIEKKDDFLKFIPILQNASLKDYLSWGYTQKDLQNGIAQKRYMTDYVGKDTENKLFKNIETITLAVTNKEVTKTLPLLKAYGYKRIRNRYFLSGSPVVYLTDIKNNIRTIQLVIGLSEPVKRQQILISERAILTLTDESATFTYTTKENYR